MIGQIARRTFTSRSALRAPPSPSSASPAFTGTMSSRSSNPAGRVAMMPKPSISTTPLSSNSTSQFVSTSTSASSTSLPMTSFAEELFEVGSVSAPADDGSKVARVEV